MTWQHFWVGGNEKESFADMNRQWVDIANLWKIKDYREIFAKSENAEHFLGIPLCIIHYRIK